MTEQPVPDPQDQEPEEVVDTPPLELPADEAEDDTEEHQDQQTG